MPRTTFDENNIKTDGPNFPVVKLTLHEVARIVCAEQKPVMEFVHNLNPPSISRITGEPELETKTSSEGSSYQVYKRQFLGNVLCVGDSGILDEKGFDPRCPACKLANESDMLKLADPRYAINVLQYATKPGSSDLVDPFTVQTKVWRLSANRYATVVGYLKEAGITDPRKYDFILELKEPPVGMQKYEIRGSASCKLLASRDRLQHGLSVFQSSHASDETLELFCGQRLSAEVLAERCDRIRTAWQRVRAFESGSTQARDVAAATDAEIGESPGLDAALLDTPNTQQQTIDSSETTNGYDSSGLDEFSPDTTLNSDAEAAAAVPRSSVEPAPTPKDDPVDIDALLAELKST
jgi:hypothetical protein